MNDKAFEMVTLLLKIVLVAMSGFLIPVLRAWILSKTTLEQRKEAEYWVKLAVKVAEEIYKDKGQGKLKKEYVLKWLNDNKIPLTAEQADVLIELIVSEFNKYGWDSETIVQKKVEG